MILQRHRILRLLLELGRRGFSITSIASLYIPHDRLSAFIRVDMFARNFLLPFAATLVERIELANIKRYLLVRML